MNILEFLKNLFSKNKKQLNIISTDMYMKEGTHEQLEIALYENRTPVEEKELIININGIPYTRTTDQNGIARLNINLPLGEYPVTIRFDEDDEYYGDTATCMVYVTEDTPAPSPTPTPAPVVDDHYGYWVFGRDMYNVDLENLKNHGVTDIFLNYYALTVHGRDQVIDWIQKAQPINIHIWMQCFWDGEWHNPAETDLTSKLEEARSYSLMPGVAGVHLDYLRYPGNAYKTEGGTEAINDFVRRVREELSDSIQLTCAMMPESSAEYYYGQDIAALGQILDAVIPMQYKGNYHAGTEWLASTTQEFSKHATIWSGLQSYKSDEEAEPLTGEELENDIRTCMGNGAKGALLFRYGLSPDINFPHTEPTPTPTPTPTPSGDKINTILDGTNVNMQYRDGTQYLCAVYTDKERIKVPVDITINDRTYTRTPDDDGLCRLNLNLPAGTYTVKAEFKGDNNYNPSSVSNTVIIRGQDTRMEGTEINMTEGDGTVYQCAVYTVPDNNRVYDNVNITINGRTYTRTADNEGLYKLNLNLPVGNYHVKAEFYGNSEYNASSVENNIVINPKPPEPQPTELYPYHTEQGGGQMGQRTGYSCGPHSLMQCIYRLTGIDLSEYTLMEVCGTTSDGTDHEGLETGLAWFNREYGYNLQMNWYNFSEIGFSGTQEAINNGACFHHILYRDTWGHYEVPKWTDGDPIYVLNSLGSDCGDGYCGYIEERSRDEHQSYINGISQKSVCIITRG